MSRFTHFKDLSNNHIHKGLTREVLNVQQFLIWLSTVTVAEHSLNEILTIKKYMYINIPR